MSGSCWHCDGSSRCVCLFCSGRCGFCEARELWNEFESFLAELERQHGLTIDFRDSRLWVLVERRRMFLPFETFLQIRKGSHEKRSSLSVV